MRLAFGTALSLWVSQAVGWSISYIAPIITMFLLALPLSRPKPKLFIAVVLAMAVSILIGVLIGAEEGGPNGGLTGMLIAIGLNVVLLRNIAEPGTP